MRFSAHRVEKLEGECELWREIGAKDNPSFTNSWVNFGGSDAVAAFYKDKFNRVWLKGSIKSGTVDSTDPYSPAFTLPSGYRPSERVYYSSVGGIGPVSAKTMIDTTGDVNILAGTNTVITLDSISWRV